MGYAFANVVTALFWAMAAGLNVLVTYKLCKLIRGFEERGYYFGDIEEAADDLLRYRSGGHFDREASCKRDAQPAAAQDQNGAG